MSFALKKKIYKWASLFVFMFLLLILETTIFSEFRLFGASPAFLPFVVAAIALLEGTEEGVVAGLMAGILCDALYSGYEGFYTIALPILAVLVCLMNTVMYWKSFGMAVLDWVAMVMVLHIVHYCIYMLLAGKGSFISVLYVIPGEVITTLPITPFLYIALKKMLKFFEVMEED